jgi:hypothetical protein
MNFDIKISVTKKQKRKREGAIVPVANYLRIYTHLINIVDKENLIIICFSIIKTLMY